MTQQPRVRTRAPAGNVQPAAATRAPAPASAGPQDDSWMLRGQQAAQVREGEIARAQQRREQGYAPFRYRLRPPKDGQPGEQGDIIILDNELGPCFYEHAIPGPGKDWSRTTNELCPREYDNCPICASPNGESYYAMFMSVIDMRPYTSRAGVLVPFSRKLLVVKTAAQATFVRLAERHGNMRGMQLLMTRDGPMSAAIGAPEFVAMHDEQTIIGSFQHAEVRAQDGRVIKPENGDCYPFDYGRIFTRPTGEDLRRRYGGVAPAGSAQEERQAWDGHNPGTQPGAIQPAAGQPAQATAPGAQAPAQAPGGIQPAAGRPPAQAATQAPGGTQTAATQAPTGIRPASGGVAGQGATQTDAPMQDNIPF